MELDSTGSTYTATVDELNLTGSTYTATIDELNFKLVFNEDKKAQVILSNKTRNMLNCSLDILNTKKVKDGYELKTRLTPESVVTLHSSDEENNITIKLSPDQNIAIVIGAENKFPPLNKITTDNSKIN